MWKIIKGIYWWLFSPHPKEKFHDLEWKGEHLIHNAFVYDARGNFVWWGDLRSEMVPKMIPGVLYIISEHTFGAQKEKLSLWYLLRWKIAMIVDGKFARNMQEWRANYYGERG